ncbi:MAG TPA: Clp protease N-terminal domain-containing protein, partial [Anaerolineae bacterium]|nr:Clp protease N-terminal domain-containing protein [Anaerolineae bacterium]
MDLAPINYTATAQASLASAAHEATTLRPALLEPEHVLLGLLSPASGAVWSWFATMMRDPAALRSVVATALAGTPQADTIGDAAPSYRTRRVLSEAADEARRLNSAQIDTPHLLLGLLDEGGAAAQILRQRGLEARALRYWLKTRPADLPGVAQQAPARQAAATRSVPVTSAQPPFTPARATAARTAAPRPEVPARPEVHDDVPLRQALPRLISWRAVISLLAIVSAGGWMAMRPDLQNIGVFVFVIGGWIVSVSAHEFAHALVADLGGDHSVRGNGYLSFNPLKYTHPLLSIVMPVIFLLMGGIGLPGGAVYINRAALRGPKWQSAVSAAGPLASLLIAALLSIPFFFKLITQESFLSALTFWAALAGLIMLNIAGVLLNLLPIPPLDGFGILAPWLNPGLRATLYGFGSIGLMLVFLL